MSREIRKPTFKTTIELESKLYHLAKQNGIMFKQALIVGVTMLLLEKGVEEYDNPPIILREYKRQKLLLAENLKKVIDLELKLKDSKKDIEGKNK